MPQTQRNELQQVLIDTYALYLRTQNAHWNVRGPLFHSLHEMFEQQYTELAVAIDEIAERIRQLDIYVPATLTFFGKMTHVKEELEAQSAETLVKSVLEANETVKKSLSMAMQIAQKEQDEGSFDMLIQRLKAHDKAIWMLKMMANRSTGMESVETQPVESAHVH